MYLEKPVSSNEQQMNALMQLAPSDRSLELVDLAAVSQAIASEIKILFSMAGRHADNRRSKQQKLFIK